MKVKFTRQALAWAVILALWALGQPAFAIRVNPVFIDVEVAPNERHTGMITLMSGSDSEERFRASPQHFRLSRDGKIEQVPSDSSSAAEWIKFNPKEFTLAPNALQQIRYTLMPPPDIRPGDYWCALEFMNLTTNTITGGDTSQGPRINIEVGTAIIVPIFVQVGTVDYHWSLLNLKAGTDERGSWVSITLGNTANGRVPFRTEVEVLDGNGDIVAQETKAEHSLFPFSERVLRVPIETELEPGKYTARVRVSSEKAQNTVAGETILQVPVKP